ncbi:aprataxin-like [Saccostrea echinata]|uniref:aprataxin-like n=1 Tax=Saccostrea echinata TaxID=191078 RepID=UPI002A7ECE86|nr:aprataxin-like [Saccostrea echinata]
MTSKRKLEENLDGNKVSSKKSVPFWKTGLLSSMHDPELQVYKDDKLIIIKDKYPKAKYHFLVMPKENIPNLKSLKKENIDLLKHMHEKGKEMAEKSDADLKFRLGYHAVPSMSQLHLHVISQDFDSPCLKNKKHWNSFTTEYFVDSEEIIKELEKNGKVVKDVASSQELLKKDLRCHVCKKEMKTIPALKTHIKEHSYKKS